ncbi:SusC/RagA family TonB-linked outer membrane protein [Mucilaginibacter daejeonensis]|uniref:SusC/RagA family TonB-linked outer membrane protein n=1 Tax=Mucilaginibacter daejeonensis TaxID=398049 RepID=UPI001D17D0ED|nr:SusC/RagA family TonB-linked outer membrane protein [Mucilaginibacter daejeonensis]UEG52163.1 SusC/RagA family TonB-linked outer membrane protein [Mucilaginibacter daejeonensis]
MVLFTQKQRGVGLLCPEKSKLYTFLLCLVMLFSMQASAQKITVEYKNTPFAKAMADLSKKSGYQFVYDASFLKNASPVTLSASNTELSDLIPRLFQGQPFTYEVKKKTIIIKARPQLAVPVQINGKVIDTLGTPLPGIDVQVKGETAVTKTGLDGSFTISTSNSSPVIVAHSMGYALKETPLANVRAGAYVTIVMLASNANLKEVVVTGYQSISKERSTAAIVKVDSALLNQQLNPDLASAIEGRVAGLRKDPRGNDIQLRGPSTLRPTELATYPLVVIDGLPTNSRIDEINPYDIASMYVLKDAAAASIYGSKSANGVIVLTTRTGAKGSVSVTGNADYFVTTKPDLNKMHYASTSQIIDYETAKYKSEVLNYANAGAMFAYYGDVGVGSIRYYSPLYQLYRSQYEGKLTADQVNTTLNNWRNNDYIRDYTNNIWRNEARNRYNLALSSGSAKSNSFVSLNYDENAMRVKGNDSKALTMYFKSTFDFNKWLTATVGLNGRYTNSNATDTDYGNYDIQERYVRIVDENGNPVLSDYANFNDGFSSGSGGAINGQVASRMLGNADFKSFKFNVMDELQYGVTNSKALNLRAFTSLRATLMKGLNYEVSFQYETSNTNREQYYDPNSYKMRFLYNGMTSLNTTTNKFEHNVITTGGRFKQENLRSYNYTFRQQLNFDRTFKTGDLQHNIVAIGGFEARQNETPLYLSDVRYSYDPQLLSSQPMDFKTLSTTGITSYLYGRRTMSGNNGTLSNPLNRYVSFYGNAAYTLNDRYNLTGSVRVDQASFFGLDPEYRWKPIWSVGGGWNVSNEEFMKQVNWVDYLKARVTYGINGNSDLTSSPYAVATYRNDVLYPSLIYTNLSSFPNPKLRWEKVTTTNFGVDFSMFGSRIKGSLDLYNRYSSDLLVNNDLDPTVGLKSRVINNGNMRNRGIEVSLGSDWFQSKDLTLGSTVVYAYNKNTIIDVNYSASSAFSYISSPTDYYFANTSFQTMYAYKYGGMVNGYPYFLDQNGKSNVTFDANGTPTSVTSINSPAAIVPVGKLLPSFNGSFSQRIRYKDLQLNVLFVYSGGNNLRKEVVPLSAITSNTYNEGIGQLYTNGYTDMPRLYFEYPNAIKNYTSTLSDLWRYGDNQILSADYIKLRNVSLSYAIHNNFLKRIHMTNLRLTAQVNNLWYWSAAGKDIDPEAYSLNSGTRSLPVPKSFLFGLSVGF